MKIGLALDYPSLDELFLLKAMLGQGITPVLLYPYYQGENAASLHKLDAVINRIQHRYRRLRFSEYLSAEGIKCLNPFAVEFLCRSKISQKKAFENSAVTTAPWMLTEYPLGIMENNDMAWSQDFTEKISGVIGKELGYPVVVKATEGSRGSSLLSFRDRAEFIGVVSSWNSKKQAEAPRSLYHNAINPEGLFIEQLIPHAFDLRCVVATKNGEVYDFLGTLARVGASEGQVAKNTALGAMPVGVEAPERVKEIAVNCARAGVSYLHTLFGRVPEHALLGVDIMPRSEDIALRKEIYQLVQELEPVYSDCEQTKQELGQALESLLKSYGRNINKILGDDIFERVLAAMDSAFAGFRLDPGYIRLSDKIAAFLNKADLYAVELNARVDFARMMRTLCSPKLHEQIVETALP